MPFFYWITCWSVSCIVTHGQRWFFWRCISMDQFWYIKIHTWLQGSGVIKQKKSSWGSIINNTFLLFYSPKPCSQVWILIYRKWSISSLWQSSYIYFILGDPIKKDQGDCWSIILLSPTLICQTLEMWPLLLKKIDGTSQ